MINFMRFKKVYFFLSALVLVPGLVSLTLFGLKPSIDFTGGTLWEIRFEDQEGDVTGEIEAAFSEHGLGVASIQPSGESQFIIRAAPLDTEQHNLLVNTLKAKVGEFEDIRFETLGPTLGRELLFKAFLAIILASLAILGYVAYRFKNLMYGMSAILAMFHDSFILLGFFSLLGYFMGVEIGTLFVTAVLTTLSFSVHDTVVVFDRIREILRRSPSLELKTAVNQAVGETLVRSINNSLTIIFMLLALLLLGGEGLRWFVLALLVGTVAGTYSSTFTAAPLLLVWQDFSQNRPLKRILRRGD